MANFSFLRLILHVFVYIVIVCPISEVDSETHGGNIGHLTHGVTEHSHKLAPPCSTCPRHGRCLPRIQCPAHLRPGSYNPECHLDRTGAIGVCCFTGSSHAAESDHKFRASSAVSAQDTKVAHRTSHNRLEEWLKKERDLDTKPHTIVNITSPSFAHYMSMMTYDTRADTMGKGGLLNLFAAQELKARQAISDDELSLGLTEHTDGPFCPPSPSCPAPPSRYRSVGGECNNPANPGWGAVHSGFERLLPPDYSDGTWSMRTSRVGLPLPSARAVSAALVLDGSHPSSIHNLMFMQFGQFIVHDISSGVVFNRGEGNAISCCSGDGQEFLPPDAMHWACAPISTEADAFYGQFHQKCHNFVRTQLAPNPDCSVGYAKQMNGATHYLDLSHLYGSSEEKFSALRAPGGLLATFNDYGRELPPLTTRKECLVVEEGAACFESGDGHGNMIISLMVLHTIFTREHNRVARALATLNPQWSDDTVFLETRRILQAEFQHIVYNEWLPLLIGPQLIDTFKLSLSEGYSSSYDPHINAALTAEFSTAAMRFGHSTVAGNIMVPNVHSGSIYETVSIPELMFQPTRMRLRPFLDRLLAGLTWQPMQAVDPFVTEGLSRYLFHGGNPFGLDLAAINIQRGRDYGIRSYNEYRRLNGMAPFTDFSQFSPNTAKRLASVYSSPEDIDLWLGGLLEEAMGGLVGATFGNILADQFARLKKGDRYFYENDPEVNPGAFTPSQLSELKKVTLSRIICDNSDGIELTAQPPRAFLVPDLSGNEPVPCNSPLIPTVDLSVFKI